MKGPKSKKTESAGSDSDEEDEKADTKQPSSVIDELNKLKRTIFVGNLPVGIKGKVIKRVFAFYGTVESVRIRSVPLAADNTLPRRVAILTKTNLASSRSGDGKGKEQGDSEKGEEEGNTDSGLSVNAYVMFQTRASAVAALGHNMKEIKQRTIRVDLATPNNR